MLKLPDPSTLELDELSNRVYAVQMCKMLRELLKLDPNATQQLITTRAIVNTQVVESGLVKILDVDGYSQLGVLGLINGLLARMDGGAHQILAIFDGTTHQVIDFQVQLRPQNTLS